jgi:hypothetical protein
MKLRVITLCALAALTACQKNSGTAPAAKKAPHVGKPAAVQAGPTPEQMTAGMVEAVTQGKSLTAVGLKFELAQRPVAGQPLEVGIALLPQIAGTDATVAVSGPDELKLAADDTEIDFAAVTPSQVYRHVIRLIPRAEGVFLLTLSVNLKHDPYVDTRVFAVPIIVEPAVPPTAGPAAAADVAPQQTTPTPAHRGS